MTIEDLLEKALWMWESPVTGNSVVVLRAARSVPGGVIVADLDMGETYGVFLADLRNPIRRTELADYGFSWCEDVDADVLAAVKEAYEEDPA